MNIKKILIIGEDRYLWYAPAWKQALCELGLNAYHYSYTTKWSPGIVGWVEQRFMIGAAIVRINKEVLALCKESKPDVILLYAAHPIYPATVNQLVTQAWVTTYHNDDPFGTIGKKAYFRYFRQALPYADSHHVYRETNILDYRQQGASRVALLYSYYIPWLDRSSISSADKSYITHDVLFIGHCEADHRIKYIQALVNDKIDIKIYGTTRNWKSLLPRSTYKQLHPIIPIYGQKYRDVLSKSKICLCFFSSANRDQYTRRVFEIPAVGGFLLSERTDVMRMLYEEDKEAVYFSSTEELIDKVKYYLKNETDRLKIAQAGYERCLNSGYDIGSRMSQWATNIQNWIDTSNYK